ncbi:hypothetical protein AOLI_G00052450 [Acnodon oligacanthus]
MSGTVVTVGLPAVQWYYKPWSASVPPERAVRSSWAGRPGRVQYWWEIGQQCTAPRAYQAPGHVEQMRQELRTNTPFICEQHTDTGARLYCTQYFSENIILTPECTSALRSTVTV